MRRSVIVIAAATAVLLTAGSLWQLSPQRASSDALAALPMSAGIAEATGARGALASLPETISKLPQPGLALAPAGQEDAGNVGPSNDVAAAPTDPAPMVAQFPEEGGQGQPANSSAPSAGLRPMPTRGVLHGIANHSWAVTQGDASPARRIEFWVDVESGDARLYERDVDGTF